MYTDYVNGDSDKITGYHDYKTLESLVKPLLAEKPPAKKSADKSTKTTTDTAPDNS